MFARPLDYFRSLNTSKCPKTIVTWIILGTQTSRMHYPNLTCFLGGNLKLAKCQIFEVFPMGRGEVECCGQRPMHDTTESCDVRTQRLGVQFQ